MIPHAAMSQAGGQYMQQQAPIFPPKTPLQFTPQQVQELQQQQQLHHPQMMPFQGHMGVRPVGAMNGMHAALHTESSNTGGGNEAPSGGAGMSEPPRGSTPSITADGRGSKPDAGSAASDHTAVTADSQKNSGSGDAEARANPERPEGSKTP